MSNSFNRSLNLSDSDTNPPYVIFTPLSGKSLALRTQDNSNTHFTLFEFEKTNRKPRSEKEWDQLVTKGDLLKPCEYKKR